jgi:hypothetical protein
MLSRLPLQCPLGAPRSPAADPSQEPAYSSQLCGFAGRLEEGSLPCSAHCLSRFSAPLSRLVPQRRSCGSFIRLFDDDDATRQVIDRTVEFVKHATSGPYQVAMRRALPEATAAAHVQTRNYRQAATEYGDLVAARPDDARLRLAFGEALLGDAQYERACAEFEKLKGKGLGPRDLGLPAARACVQKGDPEAAIQWLKTIPSRFLPAEIQNDEVFGPQRNRPEFLALFKQK